MLGCIRTVTYKIGQTITVQGAVDSGSMPLVASHGPKHGILLKSHVYSEGRNLLQSLNEVLATYTFSTFAVVCCFQIHSTRSLLESLQNLDTIGYPQIKILVSHESIGSWQRDRNCQHAQLYCRYIIKGGSAEIYVNHRFVKEACLPAGKCLAKNGNRKVVGTFL